MGTTTSSKPVRLLIIGAGDRGTGYAKYAELCPDKAAVAGVAEPRDFQRSQLAAAHGIPLAHVFTDWKQAAALPKFADAAIICTQDAMHLEPAIAFAEKGYHILLEKPMAPHAADCVRITDAVRRHGIIFGVCHVLRYTTYTRELKRLLDAGAVGEIVSVDHVEPVGYWHQAHSFVRGNWRNEKESSFMLLAKSCHDLDWLRHIVGRPCERVSSFGRLTHFTPANRPAGAADRCLDCAVEGNCPYSAKRLYFKFLNEKKHGWPLSVVTHDFTPEALEKALSEGPYGRCVYACDNDVVDHQVVNLEFQGGATATFTMTAFSHMGCGRSTRIFGTRGEITGDSAVITVHDFLTNTKREIDTRKLDASVLGGHGGGDGNIMESFVSAIASNDPSKILSGPAETLESHLMVFAAEKARREGRIVEIAELAE